MKTFNRKVCIAIPIYKNTLCKEEQISLQQVLTVLKKYPIYFIAPKQLDINVYKNFFIDNKTKFRIKRFSNLNFVSTESYNKLLLNPVFYLSFIRYKYILLYQLDAFVFKDQLAKWCEYGYDFVGAPFFEGFKEGLPNSKFYGVGNGGFSFRNNYKALYCLLRFKRINKRKTSFRYFLEKNKGFKRRVKKFPGFIKKYLFTNNTFWLFNDYNKNEDIFWGIVAPKLYKRYKVPSYKVALEFSFEVNAPKLYEELGHLPFGCHGWYTYHQHFWRKIISSFGYDYENINHYSQL